MKPVLAAMMLASTLLAGTGAAAAGGKQPQDQPLRPVGACLVRGEVRDWRVVDDRRLVVRTQGERYYDIRLANHCSALKKAPFLSFREGPRSGVGQDPVTTDGRICGDLGDAVLPDRGSRIGDEVPCGIDSVRRIDRATFDVLFGKSAKKPAR
jgi:hypothetical protein